MILIARMDFKRSPFKQSKKANVIMNNVNRETTSFFLSKGQLKTFLNATLYSYSSYSYSSERHNGIDDVYLNYSAKIQKILNKNITISQMLTDIVDILPSL